MNNVYLTCRIINKSDICFDYYNKLKPYVIFKCIDLDSEDNVFSVLVYNKESLKTLVKFGSLNIFVYGSIVVENGANYILSKSIYAI